MGDALCSFHPLFGPGMSVVAQEAKVLDAVLRDQHSRAMPSERPAWTRRFQKALARVVQAPWRLASCDAFGYRETQGNRPLSTRLFNWYMRHVSELMASQPLLALRGDEVLHLRKPLSAVFEPRIVWAVLGQELASRFPHPKPEPALATDKANLGNFSGLFADDLKSLRRQMEKHPQDIHDAAQPFQLQGEQERS
jgi:hypothetical protein